MGSTGNCIESIRWRKGAFMLRAGAVRVFDLLETVEESERYVVPELMCVEDDMELYRNETREYGKMAASEDTWGNCTIGKSNQHDGSKGLATCADDLHIESKFEDKLKDAEGKTYGSVMIRGDSKRCEENIICLRNISFYYNEEKIILRDLNLYARQGEFIALVGLSGGGKSTVIKMLLGFYQPQSGEISIGGKSLSAYTIAEHRKMISYVPQEAHLFNTTVAENIRYGNLTATDEQIVRAAKAAYAHEFISTMQEGYNTIVGERGARLSGGEKQRIAIARAFLKDAPILLLDEATSALDSESEQLVQRALRTLAKGRTVVAVAHRHSTIEGADRIYVLEQGCVSEIYS